VIVVLAGAALPVIAAVNWICAARFLASARGDAALLGRL
jgi:hypothetical protein